MSRESKIFTAPAKQLVAGKIKDYESFGWELLSVNGLDVSMSRETQNPVYAQLVKYENEYEDLVLRLLSLPKPKQYVPMELKTSIILFCLLVFPFVLYYLFKKKQKEETLAFNNNLENERNMLIEQIQKVCNDSRATFFSKQEN